MAGYDTGSEAEGNFIDYTDLDSINFNLDDCVCADGYFMDQNHKCVPC